jgi:hypothetical protein
MVFGVFSCNRSLVDETTTKKGDSGAGSNAGGNAIVIDYDGGFQKADTAPITGPTDDANCGVTSADMLREIPHMLIVLDRSGSMTGDITSAGFKACPTGTSCVTRWKAVTDAITSMLGTSQANVAWGLKFFATPGGTVAQGGECHVASGPPEVPFSLPFDPSKISTNNDSIVQKISSATPTSATPTREAIKQAADYLLSLNLPNPKFILLATDGEPNCATLGSQDLSPDLQGAIDAVRVDAAGKGIPVFVVGISIATTSTTTLNYMAQAGGRGRQDPNLQFYPANDAASLATAMQTIARSIIQCTFELVDVPPDPNFMGVYLDGNQVPKDPGNGWAYSPPTTAPTKKARVTLNGSYCDGLKDGKYKTFKVLFGCPGVPLPPIY